jgi:tetratricopeptide (TPR) repeat protein
LRDLTLTCLAKDPDKRPSAAELVSELATAGHGVTHERGDGIYLERRVRKGAALREAGRHQEARDLLEKCLSLAQDPIVSVQNPPGFAEVSVNILMSLAVWASEDGDNERAAELAERALDLAPDDSALRGNLLTNISNYYLTLDPERAIEYAREAVRLDPHDWQALGNLAEGARIFGHALRARWMAQGTSPESGETVVLDEGATAVSRALELNPSDLKLLITQAGIYLAQGDVNRAGTQARKLINANGGDDVPLRVLLIRCLIRAGDLDQALQWIEPMRQYEGLAQAVEAMDQELALMRAFDL